MSFPDLPPSHQSSDETPLDHVRMKSIFYTQSSLKGAWGIELPRIQNSTLFHLILKGTAHLCYAHQTIPLKAGDFALLPHGLGHCITAPQAKQAVPLADLPLVKISQHYETLQIKGTGEETVLLCGAVLFDHEATAALLKTMPAHLLITQQDGPYYETIRTTIETLAHEVQNTAFGGHSVITRLADILILQAIRVWLKTLPLDQSNWIQAYSDPHLCHVLAHIHKTLDQTHDIQKLAQTAGMSRSGFIAYFKEKLGVPPMKYITHWRLTHAKDTLSHDTSRSILAIALESGYQSEAAFSRAFKHKYGVSPSHYRQKTPRL